MVFEPGNQIKHQIDTDWMRVAAQSIPVWVTDRAILPHRL
jgi:hypothetical protein